MQADAKTVEYVRRPERLGLGAEPGMLSDKKPKKYIKACTNCIQCFSCTRLEGIASMVDGIRINHSNNWCNEYVKTAFR